MKIPHTDPLAEAALAVLRDAIPTHDRSMEEYKKGPADKYTFDLYRDGCVAIKLVPKSSGRVTLSMAGYFKIPPLIQVKGKDRQIVIGPKPMALSPAVMKNENFKVVAAANVKEWKKANPKK